MLFFGLCCKIWVIAFSVQLMFQVHSTQSINERKSLTCVLQNTRLMTHTYLVTLPRESFVH